MIKAIVFDFFGVVFTRTGWDWSIDHDLMELIEKLHKDCKISLLSNSSQTSARTILKEQGVINLFDEIIVSSEVGFSKPQPEIFEFTIKKLGVKANETVFVDDSIYNVRAAEAIGIKSILYKDSASLKEELTNLGIRT